MLMQGYSAVLRAQLIAVHMQGATGETAAVGVEVLSCAAEEELPTVKPLQA
jgi:hypothetical protein